MQTHHAASFLLFRYSKNAWQHAVMPWTASSNIQATSPSMRIGTLVALDQLTQCFQRHGTRLGAPYQPGFQQTEFLAHRPGADTGRTWHAVEHASRHDRYPASCTHAGQHAVIRLQLPDLTRYRVIHCQPSFKMTAI